MTGSLISQRRMRLLKTNVSAAAPCRLAVKVLPRSSTGELPDLMDRGLFSHPIWEVMGATTWGSGKGSGPPHNLDGPPNFLHSFLMNRV